MELELDFLAPLVCHTQGTVLKNIFEKIRKLLNFSFFELANSKSNRQPSEGCLKNSGAEAPHSWARVSPMGSVITRSAARSRATGDLLRSTSLCP